MAKARIDITEQYRINSHKTLTTHEEYLIKEDKSVKDNRYRAIMYNSPSPINNRKKIYYIKPEKDNITKIHNQ